MSIIGRPRHFHTKFKFQVEIDGLGSAAFQSCSELQVDVAKIEYYEGGVIRPYKEPGRMNVPDLTLERGVTENSDLYNWMLDTVNAATNSGLRADDFKRGAYLVQLDRDNEVLRRYQLYNLWPMSFTAGAWDNNSDELTMEKVVLAYDYFVMRENNLGGATTMSGFMNVANDILRKARG